MPGTWRDIFDELEQELDEVLEGPWSPAAPEGRLFYCPECYAAVASTRAEAHKKWHHSMLNLIRSLATGPNKE